MGHEVYENSDTDVTVSAPLEGHRELLGPTPTAAAKYNWCVYSCTI